MKEDNLIVSLGKAEIGEEDSIEEVVLEKLVSDYRKKTLGDILGYMLDPRVDEINTIPYNNEEMIVRDSIEEWKKGADTNQNDKFQLMYIKPTMELSRPVNLNQYVKDYNDLIKERTRTTELGEELKFTGIELVARFIPGGGYQINSNKKCLEEKIMT